MEAAAATVALIGFALTSTKTAYENVRGIHDGPQIVAEAMESLREAMTSLNGLEHDVSSSAPAELRRAVKRYRLSLDLFQSKILKIRSLPTDGTLRRSWKRIEAVLKEKDLRHLHQAAQEFTNFFIKYEVLKQR